MSSELMIANNKANQMDMKIEPKPVPNSQKNKTKSNSHDSFLWGIGCHVPL